MAVTKPLIQTLIALFRETAATGFAAYPITASCMPSVDGSIPTRPMPSWGCFWATTLKTRLISAKPAIRPTAKTATPIPPSERPTSSFKSQNGLLITSSRNQPRWLILSGPTHVTKLTASCTSKVRTAKAVFRQPSSGHPLPMAKLSYPFCAFCV
jgi:hypothetical protein